MTYYDTNKQPCKYWSSDIPYYHRHDLTNDHAEDMDMRGRHNYCRAFQKNYLNCESGTYKGGDWDDRDNLEIHQCKVRPASFGSHGFDRTV